MRFQKIIGDVIQEQASANGTIERMSKDWKSFLLFGGCRGGAAVLGADLGEGSLGNIRSFSGIFHLVLHLAVLGEVHGGDLLGLLHLALVGLDLGLELLNEILHALHVLAVLLGLECEFFESSVGLSEVLSGLGVAALFGVKLSFQLTDARLQLGDDALASLQGSSLGLVKTGLKVLDGDFELFAKSINVDGVFLLTAEFLGQIGGVGGGLLGLLLGILELGDSVIHVGLHGLEVLLQLALSTGEHGVGAGKLLDAASGVVELALGGLACSVGRLQGDAHLLQLGGEHVASTLGHVVGLAGFLTGALLILDGGLELLDLSQVLLDGLHGLGVGAVGVVQRDLQLVDVGLQLLLHAKSLGLGLGLGLQRSLHGLESAGDLSLFLLEGSLGLLKGGLELLLLHLELAAGLVQLVNGFAALSELIGEVVDLIGEDLVLALQALDMLQRLFVLGLQLEKLGGITAGLLLAGLQLDGDVFALDLPVSDELVELTLLLLHGGGVGVGALDVDHEVH